MNKSKSVLRYKTALTPIKGNLKIVSLKKENDLNKILKRQKKTKSVINILFVSLWDEHCEKLVERIVDAHSNKAEEHNEVLFLVDSYSMPHSFVIFNSTKVPHLVRLEGDRVLSEDYIPVIHQFFGLD